MQRYEHNDETEMQPLLRDTWASGKTAAAVDVQEPLDTGTEPQFVTELLATADREMALRKSAALLATCIGVQLALVTAIPHGPITVVFFFSLFVSLFFGIRNGIQYRNTTAALASADDLRIVGPLIDRLRTGHKERRTTRLVKQALMRLLPRLKASDASLLTARQKAELAQHLGRLAQFQRDKEFQVVILRTLEQVGDAHAIPVVEKIIRRQPRWSAQEQVHRAAVECLPFLLERADEDKSRNTLLRSASGSAGEASALLRPAEGGEGSDPRELLRGDPSGRTGRNPNERS